MVVRFGLIRLGSPQMTEEEATEAVHLEEEEGSSVEVEAVVVVVEDMVEAAGLKAAAEVEAMVVAVDPGIIMAAVAGVKVTVIAQEEAHTETVMTATVSHDRGVCNCEDFGGLNSTWWYLEGLAHLQQLYKCLIRFNPLPNQHMCVCISTVLGSITSIMVAACGHDLGYANMQLLMCFPGSVFTDCHSFLGSVAVRGPRMLRPVSTEGKVDLISPLMKCVLITSSFNWLSFCYQLGRQASYQTLGRGKTGVQQIPDCFIMGTSHCPSFYKGYLNYYLQGLSAMLKFKLPRACVNAACTTREVSLQTILVQTWNSIGDYKARVLNKTFYGGPIGKFLPAGVQIACLSNDMSITIPFLALVTSCSVSLCTSPPQQCSLHFYI